MSAAAIRLLSLFIIPACASSSVSPPAVLSATKAVKTRPQSFTYKQQITEVDRSISLLINIIFTAEYTAAFIT